MILWLRDEREPLPNVALAQPRDSDVPGLLAAGGSLSLQRLAEAYSQGVFPWYGEGQPVLWWTPDPRMALQVAEFKLSRSLRKTLARFNRSPNCEVRIDSAFEQVIAACAGTPRDGQSGTWIVPDMVQAYTRWHAHGQVHSFETWIDGELAGGLYGVSLGAMFFGESMFSRRTDASKIALAALVCFCRAHGIGMIDCQQHTGHLASMGARELPREQFQARLAVCLRGRPPADWTYHPALWAHLATTQAQATRVEDSGP